MKSLLLLPLLLMLPFSDHDFHVSIAQFEHNAATGRVEVAVKIFTDDLEEALSRKGLRQPNIGTASEHDSVPAFIGRYLAEKVVFMNDGIPVALAYLGSEQAADATWCYLESGPLGPLGGVRIRNTVLHEVFEDQVNIIHLKIEGRTKAKLTDRSTAEAVF